MQPGATGTVGSRIRGERLRLELSQQALGAAMGVSESYLSRVEAGQRTPSDAVTRRLAEALHTTYEYLTVGLAPAVAEHRQLLLRDAELDLRTGKPQEALAAFQDVLADATTDDEPTWADGARWGMARAQESLGHYDQAIAQLETLTITLPAGGVRWCQVVVALCRCYRETGDLARAIDLGEAATHTLTELGLLGGEDGITVTTTLVAAYQARGDLTRARLLADQTLQRAEALGSPEARASAYWNASAVHRAAGRLDDARTLADQALALMSQTDNTRNLARLQTYYARLLLLHPPVDIRRARALLRQAQKTLHATGSRLDLTYCDVETARSWLLDGNLPRATTLLDAVLADLADQPATLETAEAHALHGQLLLAQGQRAAAIGELRRAAQTLTTLGATRDAATHWTDLAQLYDTAGDLPGARDAYKAATTCLGLTPTPQP